MFELLDILDAFSTPLKVAWVVWLAWGVAQVFWYRYERKSQKGSRAAAPARKPFVSRPSMPDRPTRLVTPEQVMPKVQASSESTQAEGPGTIGELDQFVADFEMNSRSRRERPLNGELASPSNLTT
jgi:hypothetical protein